MHVGKGVLFTAVTDSVLFVTAWLMVGLDVLGSKPPLWLSGLYWATAFAGLTLGVYGFWVITRGRVAEQKRAVVVVIVALIPGIVGLVRLLIAVGARPV